MIYLIGGSPRSGKTILAKKLSQKIHCELFSIDDIRKHEISKTSKKELFKKFPFEKIYTDNDSFFQKYSPQKILKTEIIEAHTIWPKVKKLIKENIKTKSCVIIEGVQLLPAFLNEYKKCKSIKVLYLFKKNKKAIFSGLTKKSSRNDWLTNNVKQNITLKKAATTFALYGKYFEHESYKYGFNSINTEKEFDKIILICVSNLSATNK